MTNIAEQRHVEVNLAVIRSYLKDNFHGCEITEDTSHLPWCHKFTLTNHTFHKSYRLEVSGPQLFDTESTPEKTRTALSEGKVAEEMRYANGDYLKWGRI